MSFGLGMIIYLIGSLSCVSNLEQFNVDRSLQLSRKTESFKDDDWLTSIISYYLLKLIRFKFYLRTIQWKTTNESNTKKLINQLKGSFQNAHSDSYQARLIIDCS
ncbi:unnamed protein product [Rotaria socialis]|uniref:Uncharacterized protein n=1 Tax=Rotaria socialis TaxID=392032 RepID=A0A818AAH1_9BILA|nr:unnamed protein product [Rotaria socialis]CAF3426537.1 unnamed protein product [Rotaria socialis]CAF4288902.1 unnamed protein product [Rotaria socialis]CAF4545286.1 unnamed protein product [Rotaria socialis]